MKRAIIVGATGFGGLGLIEILLRHPGIEIKQLVARRDIDIPISNVFPHLRGFCDMTVDNPERIDYSDIDIAFLSTPDRAGMTILSDFVERKIPVIDFSGDFRFSTSEEYSLYAKLKGMNDEHLSPEILEHSVYRLPEIYADKIKRARVVGNPGCFAVSMILGLSLNATLVSTSGLTVLLAIVSPPETPSPTSIISPETLSVKSKA